MNHTMKKSLELFAENFQVTRKEFMWQGALLRRLAAMLYTLENKPIDCDAIKECQALIRKSTGVFSTFRGNMSFPIATMLSLRSDRDKVISNTLYVYELLKKSKFVASDYLVVAAYEIATNAPEKRYSQLVDKTKLFFDGIKFHSRFSAGEHNYIYAAMLALSDIDEREGIENVLNLFQQLKSNFSPKSSVQALSQILVLNGKPSESLKHVLSLSTTLRSKGLRFDKVYTLPALGVISLLPVEGDVVAQDILNAERFLQSQKGFGKFSITSQELLLFASAITAFDYTKNMKNTAINASVTTTIASIIIAQQIAIIVAASAASTAAAASSC